MSQTSGRTIGAWSLRLDAIYCALLGAGVALTAGPIAAVVALPQPLIATVGVAVVLWAGLVLWMLKKMQLRGALRMVLGVNVLAAVLIAVCAAAAAHLLGVVAILTIAVDVAFFAVSQAVALRRIPVAAAA